MKEELITFETGKLAKEKGLFNNVEDSVSHFYINGEIKEGWIYNSDETEITSNRIAAPTQSLLQKFLWEEHSIWAESRPLFSANEQIGIHLTISSWKFSPIVIEEDDEFDVYKGFEKVLQEALKQI